MSPNDGWFRRNVRSNHAHRPSRWTGVADALSIIALLFIIVVIVPLLWGQP